MPETPLDNIKQYQKRLRTINSKIGLAMATVFGVICVTILLLFTDYYDGSPIVMWVAVISGAAVGAVVRILKNDPSKLWLACYYAYFHVLAALFFFVVTPSERFLPGYFMYWVMLSTVTYLDIGRKVFLGSIASLGVLIGIKILVAEPMYSSLKVGEFITSYVLFLYLVFYIYMISSLAHDEEKSLGDSNLEVESERRKLAMIVDSMEEAVLLCDADLNVAVCNKSSSVLLHTDEIAGRNIDEVLHLWDKNGKKHSMAEFCNDGNKELQSIHEFMHFYGAKDYVDITMFLKVVKLPSVAGFERNYMIVLRDISKHKSDFLSVMGDDAHVYKASGDDATLSVPQLYEVRKQYEKLGKLLDNAGGSTRSLSEVVNGLAESLHNERYTNAIEIQKVDIEQLFDRLYRRLLPEAKQRGLSMKVYVAEGVPIISTNREYLTDILQNIAKNALKFTRAGTIELHAEATSHGVELSVRDTGIGISKQDIPQVFEQQWRSNDYHAREAGGSGMGMYIAKMLSDTLNAKIDVASKVGEGTVVTVMLPLSLKNKLDG